MARLAMKHTLLRHVVAFLLVASVVDGGVVHATEIPATATDQPTSVGAYSYPDSHQQVSADCLDPLACVFLGSSCAALAQPISRRHAPVVERNVRETAIFLGGRIHRGHGARDPPAVTLKT